MSVAKIDRQESKVEFDNTYFKIYEDAVKLISIGFGIDYGNNLEMENEYVLFNRNRQG